MFGDNTLPDLSICVLLVFVVLGASLFSFPFIMFGLSKVTIEIIMWWNKWSNIEWYKYLFARKSPHYTWFEVVWCRAKGHPAGVSWYCLSCAEPDMTCNGCGDDLS